MDHVEEMRETLSRLVDDANASGRQLHPLAIAFGAGNADEDLWLRDRRQRGFLVENALLTYGPEDFAVELYVHRNQRMLRLSSSFRYRGISVKFPTRNLPSLYDLLLGIPCGFKPILEPCFGKRTGRPWIRLVGLETVLPFRSLDANLLVSTINTLYRVSEDAFGWGWKRPVRWERDVSLLNQSD